MLFNSLSFAVFLPIVFALYWLLGSRYQRSQNLLLLASSYYFYACWDFRFLFLLMFSTLLDYVTGLQMERQPQLKKFWFWLSIGINLGFLGVFKYYDFFVTSFADGLSMLGFSPNISTLNWVLPVGISFYTFHGLSYVIDIYKGRIKAEPNFVDYAVFVSFFPLLVAGPIERATHLLPQIQTRRVFDSGFATDGLRQILWGLFKKIVIADNCAQYANMVFTGAEDYSGSTHLMGAIFFAFQIYGDFSGYSDIALGTAKLFGISLLRNFAYPFFSRDLGEFWRRWHISLSSWFRDYLYIPLGGSRGSTWLRLRNVMIVFLVSGLWHGAMWTFVFWGFFNGLFVLVSLYYPASESREVVAYDKKLPSFKELGQVVLTFLLAALIFVLFRAQSLPQAWQYYGNIISPSLLSKPQGLQNEVVWLLLAFILIEWMGRRGHYALEHLGRNWPKPLRLAFYYVLLAVIFTFAGSSETFIYFQF